MNNASPLSPVAHLSKNVVDELNAMKSVGINIPQKALDMAADLQIMKEYEHTDLSVTDLADLVCDLARLTVLENEAKTFIATSAKIPIMNEAEKQLDDARALWRKLGDTPINDDGELEEPFLQFEIGTPREDIWHWFETVFNLSVHDDLMFANRVT